MWQTMVGILMTGQFRWISRVESFIIPLTALFSSSAMLCSNTDIKPSMHNQNTYAAIVTNAKTAVKLQFSTARIHHARVSTDQGLQSENTATPQIINDT
jgi:hypothetical protein